LRHLGLHRNRIEARLREEREAVLLLEKKRLERLRPERETDRRSEERRAARLAEEAARRLEDEIVSWLTADEPGAGDRPT
jgi:hypothetical protein